MDAPFLVFSAKGKNTLTTLFSHKYRKHSFPPDPFLGQPSTFSAPQSPESFSPHRREDKQEGVSKPRLIQQKECHTDPSFPALYPRSHRSAESRGVLRRVRPPYLVHKDHHSNGTAIGFSPQESLWEPSTGRTRLPHNRAMQLLSK